MIVIYLKVRDKFSYIDFCRSQRTRYIENGVLSHFLNNENNQRKIKRKLQYLHILTNKSITLETCAFRVTFFCMSSSYVTFKELPLNSYLLDYCYLLESIAQRKMFSVLACAAENSDAHTSLAIWIKYTKNTLTYISIHDSRYYFIIIL